MTRRGAALLLAPCAVVAAAAVVPALLWAGLVLEAAAFGVVVLDRGRAPGRSRLRVERTHDELMSVGRPNVVRLRVDAGGVAGARILLRDEHPLDMAASLETAETVLPADVEYTLTPPRRGERRFGRTVVRVDGPWRLARRQSAVGGDDVVRVDPDLTPVRSFEALARRGQLAEIGLRVLRRPGEGTEFERVRDAVPDDPPRSINWRATARTGRLMASELVPERAQPVVLCIDHGRLMGVGAGALTKLDHAVNAAVLLAHVALRTGDRVGLLAFGDHVTATVAPRGGVSQLRALLEALRPVEAGSTEADYDEALAHLSRWQRRRALVVLLTDVVDQDQGEALLRQCARLRRRHLPLVVVVRDPALDAAATERPSDSSAAYRRAVAVGMLADRDAMLRTLRRTGVDVVDADARSLTPRLVNRYLELKRRARL